MLFPISPWNSLEATRVSIWIYMDGSLFSNETGDGRLVAQATTFSSIFGASIP